MVAKIKQGSFVIELVLYLFISVLLAQYLFEWFGTLAITAKKLSLQINSISNMIFARIKFLQIINNAPSCQKDWIVKNESKCCWKDSNGTICLYYKNGSLIQKTYYQQGNSTTRLVLLPKTYQGSFDYYVNNDLIEYVSFHFQHTVEGEKNCLIAKTRCELV